MISLSYAKKINDSYVMNFYADTESDIAAFNASKPFMNYGVPQVGSTITLIDGVNVNYYLNNAGSFVAIPTDAPGPTPTPGGDPVYSLTYDDFIVDSEYSIVANISNFAMNASDVWVASVLNAVGVNNSNVSMEYHNYEKEGEVFEGDVGTAAGGNSIVISMYPNDETPGNGYVAINSKNSVTASEVYANLSVDIYKG